jgi:hypothetical protein
VVDPNRYGYAVELGDADTTATLSTDDTVIDLEPTHSKGPPRPS